MLTIRRDPRHTIPTALCVLIMAALALAAPGPWALADDEGVQPPQAFAGPGPSGQLLLDYPPQILLSIVTEPVTGAPRGPARDRPDDAAWQEQAAGRILHDGGPARKEIRFHAGGMTGEVDAADRMFVVVASNAPSWRVVAHATDLTGPPGTIPADRLSTSHWHSRGAYHSLGAPVEVATGGAQPPRVVNVMNFRARIEPTDRAGTYTGKIEVTGLISP